MSTLRSILAATDLTTRSDRAVDAAFALAVERRTRVTICHVLATPRAPNPVYAQLYPRSLFQREAWSAASEKARLAIEARWSPGASRANLQVIVTRGDPADEIVRQAEEHHCDMIVLAAGRRRHLLGSVVEKVVRRAKCSVLIVR